MIRRPPRSTLFPSRRSSDLVDPVSGRVFPRFRHARGAPRAASCGERVMDWIIPGELALGGRADALDRSDRKSTRLNSSHGYISYAVFCLKKKNEPDIALYYT